jgi:hypothetical protein
MLDKVVMTRGNLLNISVEIASMIAVSKEKDIRIKIKIAGYLGDLYLLYFNLQRI